MTVSYLKAFTDSKSGKKFVGGFLYRCDEKSLLTDGKGHIIILDSYTSDLLCNQTIPKRLLSVFKSRGFLDGYSACFCSKSINDSCTSSITCDIYSGTKHIEDTVNMELQCLFPDFAGRFLKDVPF